MLTVLKAALGALLAAFRPRASLVTENLLLRQQLAILSRTHPRPRLRALKSRPVGRRALAPELVSLVERISRENPLWSVGGSPAN
jgi:hypothetical protein